MEEKDKLVSVVVPIYNVEKYIQKCLSSIQNQTYAKLEVILVNDGSTDSSGEIAQSFALEDDRFIYIEKENGGASSARNEGIGRATGEFISFIDADDWVKPSYFAEMVAEFAESVDIVVGRYTLIDSIAGKIYVPFAGENVTRVFSGEEKEREIIERHINAYPGRGFLIKNTLMSACFNMYRRELLYSNSISFVSERLIGGAEDYVFNLEAYYYADKIKVAPIDGYVHVIVQGSLSKKYYADAIERGLRRRDFILSSINHKQFYHKENILKALADESSRIVIGCVYGICRAKIKDKKKKIKEIMKHPTVIAIMKDNKRPNLAKGYMGIFYMLRYFGIGITCNVLSVVGRYYSIYRKLQYVQRR